MAIRTYGTMGVDWEQRVDFDRLRRERLARANEHLRASELGALLCFDMNNIRYITATHIGTWAMDKLIRFCLLPQGGEPILWDFGSAARHHQIYCPWLGEDRSRAGISTLRVRVEGPRRGRRAQDPGRARAARAARRASRRRHGRAAGAAGARGRGHPGRRRPGADAGRSEIKTQDEITLLATACAMVDSAYDQLFNAMRPGHPRERVRRARQQGAVRARLRARRGCQRDLRRALQPAPARLHRPHAAAGDPAYFDILHAYNGYRTCYYRTFAVGSASHAQVDAYRRCRDILDQAIAAIRPGVSTAEVVSLWPEAQDFGFPDEEAAFALQYGHGIGLSIWEKPIFSRLVSFDHPEVIEEGMVFALETFWPATDGWSAARIEEELVVTADGCEVITRFPAEELLDHRRWPVHGRAAPCRACGNRWADR